MHYDYLNLIKSLKKMTRLYFSEIIVVTVIIF